MISKTKNTENKSVFAIQPANNSQTEHKTSVVLSVEQSTKANENPNKEQSKYV